MDFETAVNVPLWDTAALRFSAKNASSRVRAIGRAGCCRRDDPAIATLTMGRAQLALSPASFDLNLKVEGVRLALGDGPSPSSSAPSIRHTAAHAHDSGGPHRQHAVHG
jgi:hypothetical protein